MKIPFSEIHHVASDEKLAATCGFTLSVVQLAPIRNTGLTDINSDSTYLQGQEHIALPATFRWSRI